MNTPTEHRSQMRTVAIALLASFSMLLTGCFISPGKFTSELMLGPDQDFSFTYEGEIFFLGLSQIAQAGESAKEFEPEPCYVDGTFDERDCTRNEIEGQRAAWEAGAEMRSAEAAQKAEQMSALLGGIDASDPEATAKFAQILLRQKGWERVEDKGDGVFEVTYNLSGKLTHDFMFPVIEGVPSTNPFVQIFLRDGDIVRVNAPGFSAQNDDNPMGAMMGGLAGMAGMSALAPEESKDGEEGMPNFPTIDGTFTILTTGGMQIRANNTDEGPNPTPTGEMLTWEISTRTKSAPTALIDTSQ
ncbi:MAG: hypothetical protein AAFR64_13740 [Pseudomonadota bacterium]